MKSIIALVSQIVLLVMIKILSVALKEHQIALMLIIFMYITTWI